MMPTKLKGINLDEVSLVDVPAAQDATIAIWKRYEEDGAMNDMKDDKSMDAMDPMDDMGEGEDEGMDLEDLAERLAMLEARVMDMTKRAEDAETALASLQKAADAAGFDVAASDDGAVLTKRAEPEMIDIGGTKVLKSAVPEAVLKALEAQTAELAVAKAREADAALEKRGASELPNLKGTALAKGRLLSMIGDDADLLGAIKAADAAFAAAFTEVGDHGQDASPIDQIEKLARAHMAEQKVPYETAFAAVTSKGEGARLWKIARQPSN
jgi:hypothetical protein